ncbi:hypothetical protein M8C21_030074 [Ambrosia artemisiifolia]|uniref:Inositol-tetrakisphosphate 1-kinase N-terminal domain-containing protein n=1 Tax=Ambrosia artemisiifolia TaxID=4212 RepID=A0AAD5CHB5_AMBAR|nr:hypothetical protein M8C21_030074 [Ambrosia artemisiifolia]
MRDQRRWWWLVNGYAHTSKKIKSFLQPKFQGFASWRCDWKKLKNEKPLNLHEVVNENNDVHLAEFSPHVTRKKQGECQLNRSEEEVFIAFARALKQVISSTA